MDRWKFTFVLRASSFRASVENRTRDAVKVLRQCNRKMLLWTLNGISKVKGVIITPA